MKIYTWFISLFDGCQHKNTISHGYGGVRISCKDCGKHL